MAQIIDIKRIRLEPDFEPSMKSLLRITKSMTENFSEGKTQLSLDTNLNYARLAKHIAWLEKKGFVESKIEDGKINVALTIRGREFASIISKTS
jgi:predicted transcriptional regulator